MRGPQEQGDPGEAKEEEETGGSVGLMLGVKTQRKGEGSMLTCQTPTMALAMRIKRMTKGSTKAVMVSSPSSNQASTWGAGQGRITDNTDLPPTWVKKGSERVPGTTAEVPVQEFMGHKGTADPHLWEVLRASAMATAVIQLEQASTDMHNFRINWECFQVSLTELLAWK